MELKFDYGTSASEQNRYQLVYRPTVCRVGWHRISSEPADLRLSLSISKNESDIARSNYLCRLGLRRPCGGDWLRLRSSSGVEPHLGSNRQNLLSAICYFIRAESSNEARLAAASNARVERERHSLLPASKRQSEWQQRHQLHRHQSDCQAARQAGSQIARNSTDSAVSESRYHQPR
jgi:hypothetical protein